MPRTCNEYQSAAVQSKLGQVASGNDQREVQGAQRNRYDRKKTQSSNRLKGMSHEQTERTIRVRLISIIIRVVKRNEMEVFSISTVIYVD